MSFFRPEVTTFRNRDRLPGEVLLSVPGSAYWISGFFAVCMCIAVALAATAEYPHIEALRGVVLPDKGLVMVTPSRPGILVDVRVREGEVVEADQLLAVVRVDESTGDGLSASSVLSLATDAQQESLSKQIEETKLAEKTKELQLQAHVLGITGEISQIKLQLAYLNDLIASAQHDLDRVQALAKDGFSSQKDQQNRLDTLTQRRLSASSLAQALYAKQAELEAMTKSIVQLQAETAVQVASLTASKAQLDQQAVNIKLSGAYQLRAPVAGYVANLAGKVGQSVGQRSELLTLVPAGSVLRAELNIPSSTIGFIRRGQIVRLAIDSFPYQKFGTMTGTVDEIASSATAISGNLGTTTLVYPTIVKLSAQSFNAKGNDVALVPGMTLGARIVTERRTLLEWLFEPVISVRRRD